MRSAARQLAHVLERFGLAMAGAACGLFVGIQVASGIAAFTNQGFLIIMTIAGAAGAYLGIDTPPHRFQPVGVSPLGPRYIGRIDSAEMLTAVGTFLAAMAAFASVALIVFDRDVQPGWNTAILIQWSAGVLMQIAAGSIARIRRQS